MLSHNHYDFVFFVDYHFVIPLEVLVDIFSCYEFSGHPEKTQFMQKCLSTTYLLLDEVDVAYGGLILHADVRRLSRAKVLRQFIDLPRKIVLFLSRRNKAHEKLSDDGWSVDLGLLTDLPTKLD